MSLIHDRTGGGGGGASRPLGTGVLASRGGAVTGQLPGSHRNRQPVGYSSAGERARTWSAAARVFAASATAGRRLRHPEAGWSGNCRGRKKENAGAHPAPRARVGANFFATTHARGNCTRARHCEIIDRHRSLRPPACPLPPPLAEHLHLHFRSDAAIPARHPRSWCCC